MIDLLYKSFSKSGGDQLLWKLDTHRLRILCYHAVCEDRLANAPWLPSFFVTKSAFEEQLDYLKRNTHVLSLAEGVALLQKGALPPRAVCLTFDDGYANNIELAHPLLKQYGVPATIFLSSAYVESGDFYPFLKLKLIRHAGIDHPLPDYKNSPVDTVIDGSMTWWPEVDSALTADQRRTLKPMTVADLMRADPQLVDFGAHSHTHCIFRNESRARRTQEIQTSIRKVTEWTGQRGRLFSYPNGENGDFDSADKEALRAEGIEAAVSGIGGANRCPCDLLELRRYPITLHHTMERFQAEVTGFRNALRGATSRIYS